MTRLILAMLFLAVILIAVQVVADFLRPAPARVAAPHRPYEVAVPKTVQTVAYVLLIVLAFGVTSGWLGGAS